MKRPNNALLFALLVTVVMCTKDKAMPLSETIRHVWTAPVVLEKNPVVFTKGGPANIRNYSICRLDLSSPPTVQVTDADGNTFAGQYELQGKTIQSGTKLILKNLQPQPTGTNGTLEFTVSSATSNALAITRTTTSPRTGGSMNRYQLMSN